MNDLNNRVLFSNFLKETFCNKRIYLLKISFINIQHKTVAAMPHVAVCKQGRADSGAGVWHSGPKPQERQSGRKSRVMRELTERTRCM